MSIVLRDDLAEWSKIVTERQITNDIIYMWNLKKYDTNERLQNRNRLTDIKKQTCGYEKGEGVGRDKLGIWD